MMPPYIGCRAITAAVISAVIGLSPGRGASRAARHGRRVTRRLGGFREVVSSLSRSEAVGALTWRLPTGGECREVTGRWGRRRIVMESRRRGRR